MKLGKKIILAAFAAFMCTTSAFAEIRITIGEPDPAPRPAPVRPAPSHRRVESIEGRIEVHGRNVYLETYDCSYLLILNYYDIGYDRRDFEYWEGYRVTLEGYIDDRNEEIEVTRVVRHPKAVRVVPVPAPAKPAPARPAPAPAKPAPQPPKPAPAKPAPSR